MCWWSTELKKLCCGIVFRKICKVVMKYEKIFLKFKEFMGNAIKIYATHSSLVTGMLVCNHNTNLVVIVFDDNLMEKSDILIIFPPKHVNIANILLTVK